MFGSPATPAIRRHRISAPRSTPRAYRGWLGALDAATPLSLYLHIPFCDEMCWFCGCYTKIVHRYEPIRAYLDALMAEVALVADSLPGRFSVRHVHWGGGSPTMLAPARLAGAGRPSPPPLRFHRRCRTRRRNRPARRNRRLHRRVSRRRRQPGEHRRPGFRRRCPRGDQPPPALRGRRPGLRLAARPWHRAASTSI